MSFAIPFKIYAAIMSAPPYLLNISNGLVAYWTFDGKDINWTAATTTDRSGNGNTGTMANMSATTSTAVGKVGQALSFDGATTYISLASSPIATTSSPGSVCAWAYIKDITLFPNAWNQTFLNLYINSSNGIDMEEIVNTGSFGVAYKVGGTAYGAQSSAQVFKNNTWSHVCYVWNGSGIALYSNGVSLATSSNSDSIGPSSTIGARDAYGDGNWGGRLDDIHVYKRALSAAEILQLYDMGSAGHSDASPSAPGIVSTSCSSGLTCGLVGYWTFDGKDINWTAATTTDRSGNGNTGTLVNMSATTSPVVGKIGQALGFNGTSQYVNGGTGASLNLTGNQSYSVWIKPTASSGNKPVICNNDAGLYSNAFCLYIRNSPGTDIGFQVDPNGTNIAAFQSGTISYGKWNHIVGVLNGSNVSVYLNGVLTYSGAGAPTSVTRSFEGVLIGSGVSLFYPGAIDDVRIYNRALSASEVLQLYDMGSAGHSDASPSAPGIVSTSCSSGLTCGLVGYWTFDGKDINWTAATTTDRSGNGNTGTLVNMSATTSPVVGKIGQALRFNGANSYITGLSGLPAAMGDFTLSAWVKSASSTNGHNSLWYHDTNNRLYINPSGGGSYYCINGTGCGSWAISVGMDFNTWNFILIERKGITASIYKNGIFQASYNVGSTTIPFNNGTISTSNVSSYTFNGSIDDYRIYNRALSAGEVKQLYDMGR